jgi:hypothetical protein
VADVPDRAEHQRRFMALSTEERRAILRAVNRGRAVEVRKHAPLAVGVARRQRRFWRWAWLLGPILMAVQLALVPPEVALANGGLATLALVLVSIIWYRKAVRAEQLNLAIVEGRSAPGRGRARTGGGHLPGETRRQRPALTAEEPDAEERSAAAEPGPTAPGIKPYRPRGRKRRGRR